MIQNPRLKALEALAAEAAKALTLLGDEKARLEARLQKLEGENKHLKEELRQAQASRHLRDKLKTRLEKLAQKLERLE